MKLTTASLILSGALAAWAANADNNKAPLLNDENIERMYPKGVAPELIKRVKAKLEEKFEEYLLTN